MFGFSGRNKSQTYADPVEEFYRPHRGGTTVVQRTQQLGYSMGRNGRKVNADLLKTQAEIYRAELAGARRTIAVKLAELHARQKDPMRIVAFGLVFLAGLAVTTMAIFVDYTILEEIWSRNFANEFFEVPASLQSSVTFKSLQVVFAVLALHYFVSSIGKVGRGIYIGVLAAMVLTMLVGIGFLNTSTSLPIGSTFFGVELTGETLSAQNELAALGLEADVPADEAAAQEVAPPPFGLTEQGYETAKTVLFFASFGLIFFFVSSVGALSLHYALGSFNSFTGGTRGEKAESDHARDTRDRDHSDLNMRLLRAERAREYARHPKTAAIQFLNMFAAAYLEGIEDGSRYRLFGRNSNSNDDSRAAALRAALDEAIKHVRNWPDREEEVEPDFTGERRPQGYVAANDRNGQGGLMDRLRGGRAA